MNVRALVVCTTNHGTVKAWTKNIKVMVCDSSERIFHLLSKSLLRHLQRRPSPLSVQSLLGDPIKQPKQMLTRLSFLTPSTRTTQSRTPISTLCPNPHR